MDSSVSLEDRIWFLRLCRHIPFSLYSWGSEDTAQFILNIGTYVRYAPADLPLGQEASKSIEFEALI